MSEIINLKRYRKRLARQQKEQEAQVKRQRYGRSKAERKKADKEKSRGARHIDGHKRES
jgi:hypothetical protein